MTNLLQNSPEQSRSTPPSIKGRLEVTDLAVRMLNAATHNLIPQVQEVQAATPAPIAEVVSIDQQTPVERSKLVSGEFVTDQQRLERQAREQIDAFHQEAA